MLSGRVSGNRWPERRFSRPPRGCSTTRWPRSTPASAFDELGDEVFRDLVIARVVEPTSLLDIDRVLADLGRVLSEPLDPQTHPAPGPGRHLQRPDRDRLLPPRRDHRRRVVMPLRRDHPLLRGREGRRPAQRSASPRNAASIRRSWSGCWSTATGSPSRSAASKGNKAETATIVPIIKDFQARHDLVDMVVVADAGMLSAGNLDAFEEAGLRFIVGSRATKAPGDLESPLPMARRRLRGAVRSSTPSPPRTGA